MVSRPRPIPALQGLAHYNPPRPGCPIDLRLDGNEGMTPPPELLAGLSEAGPGLLRHYPSAAGLESMLARTWGLRDTQVIVTAGGDDALYRAFTAVLCEGREVVLPTPTFEMLPRYAALSGARVRNVPWTRGPFPTAEVLAQVNDSTALICVVSPNNPTGAVATASDLRVLSEAAPHALLVVDLAYEEFADAPLMQTALELPNALAMRTLSKAWGLAGLRVGYAAGPEEFIGWLRAVGNPYSVSHASLHIAQRRLAMGQHDVEAFLARVRLERSALVALLCELGAAPLPSQGNFVLAGFRNAPWVRDALAGLGIGVRLFAGRPELEGMLRITTPGEEQAWARLEHALRSALAPEAVLFDMDGVLADVSRSYRQAIMDTAALYGIAVDAAAVAAAKAEGDSNNDWVLTHRLLGNKGVKASLQEVTERFEQLYQGAGGRPGLRELECLLCDKGFIARVAARYPVAVVTGRPRADALRFLDRHGLTSVLRGLVCMEDAPLKPDPAPVKLALEQLGARRAWMIGDSPDDMRAARGAGVIPIGIVSPGDRPEIASQALTRAGASRILTDLAALEELLP